MAKVVFVFLLIFQCQLTFGQKSEKVFRSAISAICWHDTSVFLKLMEKYSTDYETTKFPVSAYLLKALILRQTGDYNGAIVALEKGINIYNKPENLFYATKKCDWIINQIGNNAIVTDYVLLRTIASTYQKMSDFNKALEYLNSIDRNSFQFATTSCLNGLVQLEKSIAYQKSECYLGLKDTSSAIDHLVDYCIFSTDIVDLDQRVIMMLRELLLKRYSRSHILEEIENSIDSVKTITITNGAYQAERVEYTLFGRKIPFLFMDLKEFKLFITTNKNIAILKE